MTMCVGEIPWHVEVGFLRNQRGAAGTPTFSDLCGLCGSAVYPNASLRDKPNGIAVSPFVRAAPRRLLCRDLTGVAVCREILRAVRCVAGLGRSARCRVASFALKKSLSEKSAV